MAKQKGSGKMASDTAVAEPNEAEASANAEAGENETDEQKQSRARNGVYVQTPAELRERLEQEAEKAGVSPATYVRNLLASQWGITLPEAPSRQVYASPDERKAAQTARRKERQELIKQLLEQHKAQLAAKNGTAAPASA